MDDRISRRNALKQLGVAGAGAVLSGRVLPGSADHRADLTIAGHPAEIAIASISPVTARITISPLINGSPVAVPFTGALAIENPGKSVVRARDAAALSHVKAGDLVIKYTAGPPTLVIETAKGEPVQRLRLDETSADVGFTLGNGPILGLGEGGPQFDRKGKTDRMVNGQGGYQLATNGTRAPLQWFIGTGSYALLIHQPYGSFDFTGTKSPDGIFSPRSAAEGRGRAAAAAATPPEPTAVDIFVVGSGDPKVIMHEYALISGFPEMPALWTFGYQQSHRTLAGKEEILDVAKTFRDKKLPCDALIYLGTEFCPSGWNTRNGEFTWHPTNFPDPKENLQSLHDEHFKVILHVVIEGSHLTGRVTDACTAPPLPSGRTPDDRWPPDRQVACYWPAHKPAVELGVDGWWPDQGDGYDGVSRLNRHRMYWEGMQELLPNVRPYALHRNASSGVQRYGGFIWSGDISSKWQTLATHVSVAINTGLSGLPYWGTDIGGFIPTVEYTGELQVRWFQFGAFCSLFRGHGRHWHLRLPWGWDGGDGGPMETNWRADPAELHNKQVEPISKKYLELRYQLLPYIYTAARETHDTGLPMMRAMWIHEPNDAVAVARGDQYFWGPNMLVAPVVEKGATTRELYLPHGPWVDFWTEQPAAGGQSIQRQVDLATTPLYVRGGAVIPMGPIKQYADEPVDAPLRFVVYPGADGTSQLYEDDGKSFDYRNGAFSRLSMTWHDASRKLTIAAVQGSKKRKAGPIEVRVAGSPTVKTVQFNGQSVDVQL